MADVLLHSGAEHPELTWILVASIAALALGLAIGLFSERVRSWFGQRRSEAPDSE